MIELTNQQTEAMEAQIAPLHLVNPRTKEVFVLIHKDVYDLTCNIVSVPNRNGWNGDDDLIQKRP